MFAAYLFPFRRFAVQVRNVHQLHLADVMVTAQGIDEDAGSVHGRDGRDGQLRCLAAELDGVTVRVAAMRTREMM